MKYDCWPPHSHTLFQLFGSTNSYIFFSWIFCKKKIEMSRLINLHVVTNGSTGNWVLNWFIGQLPYAYYISCQSKYVKDSWVWITWLWRVMTSLLFCIYYPGLLWLMTFKGITAVLKEWNLYVSSTKEWKSTSDWPSSSWVLKIVPFVMKKKLKFNFTSIACSLVSESKVVLWTEVPPSVIFKGSKKLIPIPPRCCLSNT